MKKCNKSTAKGKYTREGSTQFQSLNFFRKATLSCCLMRSLFDNHHLGSDFIFRQKLVGNGCSRPILLQCMEYKNRPEFVISKVSRYSNYVVWHG
nr:hypothetical protein CFP56_15160 [Quercus suber]